MTEHRSHAREGFPALSLFRGHLGLSMTQSTGTAMGNVPLLPTHVGPQGSAAVQSTWVAFSSSLYLSHPLQGCAESQPCGSRVALGEGIPPSCPRFSPGEGEKRCCSLFQPSFNLLHFPLSTTSTVAKASRDTQIQPSLVVLFRWFWPIYFFLSAFQGELKCVQLRNSML